MKPEPIREEYGYVSGRVVANFINGSLKYGIKEEVLKDVPLSKSFETYRNCRNLILWNEFISLVEKVYQEVGSLLEMEKIGRVTCAELKDLPSVKWVGKLISLKAIIKRSLSAPYNYPNLQVSHKLVGDELSIHYTLPNAGDRFSEAFFHMLQGSLEHAPVLFGYSPLKKIELSIKSNDKSAHFECELPASKGGWRNFKKLITLFKTGDDSGDLVREHSMEVLHMEQQNRKELDSLYGLIADVRDAVLIVRDEQILIQNKAFDALCGHVAELSWAEYFLDPDAIRKFIKRSWDSDTDEELVSTLYRKGLPSISVTVNHVSVRKSEEQYEAILKIRDRSIPSDPHEILTVARELERKSLARDIHDSLGQLLTATSFQLASLGHTETDEKRSNKIAQISQMVREITLYSRKFTRQLDLLLDECKSVYEAVELIKDEFSVISGVVVKNHTNVDFTVPHHDAIRNLSCVLQEALNNAYRHGHATEVLVSSKSDQQQACWIIEDNGTGMPEEKGSAGLGLRSMEYRVSSLGGKMSVAKSDKGGVKLEFTFKIDKEMNI